MNSSNMQAADALYREDIWPVVIGNLPERARIAVTDSAMTAGIITENTLRKYGILSGTNRPIVMDKIDPEQDGLVNGYTNGNNIGLNEYIVPHTSAFYKLSRKLSESQNPFAKYLYDKLSRPINNLVRTIVHEKLHIATQMKERYTGSGSRTDFLTDLQEATKEYLNERLPRFLKPLSEYLASRMIVPMAEGLNEGMTYEAFGLKGNRKIKEAAANEPTSYARFTEIAADSLNEIGTGSPGEFYGNYFRDGCIAAKKYVGAFFKSFGRYLSQQPQAACACTTV
jgi:hypothetical protein